MNHNFFKQYTHERLRRYTHGQMSLTYWFVFVYDRTEKDVLRVAELNNKYLNRTITAEEQEEWLSGIKGALNASDLNRIEWNTYLIGDFELIKLSLQTKSWNYGDIPRESDFLRILDNIQKIRDSWEGFLQDTPETPSQPMTDYEKWNAVEKILHDITYTYAGTAGSFYYSGSDIYAGEGIGII